MYTILAALLLLLLLAAVLAQGDGYFSCPEMDRVFHDNKEKMALWNLARRQVGLPPLRETKELLKFINDFLFQTNGVKPNVINNTVVSYLSIKKAASEDIYLNLKHVRTAESPIPLKDGWRLVNETMFHEYARALQPPRELKSFTFVREPLARFRAGFREYIERCPQELLDFNASSHGVINTNFLKSQIRRVLSGKRPALSCGDAGFEHLFAMSGALRPFWNLTFVGRVERFTEDWRTVERMYGIQVPINRSLGSHTSSRDKHGVEPAFALLQESDPRYMRAVCVILRLDYRCFDYELPTVCSDLLHT